MRGGSINTTLKNSFLFAGFSDEKFRQAKQNFGGETCHFERGETIYSPDAYQKKIGIVLSGECEVSRLKHGGGRVVLNALLPGASFGITAIFSDEKFPTVITAKRKSSIVFITKDELLNLISHFPDVALNIIKFQNNRIAFLNNRIETFSAGTVEERLACFLLGEYRRTGNVTIETSRKKMAEQLGVGRASLYRVLDSLAADGLIAVETKKIIILDLEGLERNTK